MKKAISKRISIVGLLILSPMGVAPALGAGSTLEEIVVTAQRREQSINDVSATISAFTSEDVNAFRITDPTDIANLVSNTDIKVTTGAGNPAITIRGIGLNSFEANTSGAAGVYVDDVYLGSPALNMNIMYDVERMEVLKGPQGTLYGRNTTAGAINIINQKPSHESDAYITAGYGNYDTTEVEGAIGGGLSDSVAGRLSFRYERSGESFMENLLTGDDFGDTDIAGVRGQLLFTSPSETVQTHVSIHYNKNEGTAVNVPTGEPLLDPQNPVNPDFSVNLCEPAVNSGKGNVHDCVDVFSYPDTAFWPELGALQQGADDHEFVLTPDTITLIEDNEIDLIGGLVRVDWDISDELTLVSITGYESMSRDWGELGSAHPLTVFNLTHDEDIESFSQEFRLLGSADNYNWITGVYYSSDTFESENIVLLDELLLTRLSYVNDQEVTAMAVFANIDYQLSEKNTLIAGLRYSNEEVEFEGGTVDLNPFDASCLLDFDCLPTGLGAVPLAYTDDDIDEDNISFKLALEHRPNDDLLVYGSVSSGFKSGGFPGTFAFSDIELLPFDSEDMLAYEIGAKATLAEGRVQLNGAIYYYDWEDIQTLIPAALDLTVGNADGAQIFGAELELVAQATDNLMFLVGFSYQDSELEEIGDAPSGNTLPNAPEYQALAMARYEIPINDQYGLTLQGNVKYTDEMYRDALNDPINVTDSYTVADARITLHTTSDLWEVSLWGENIFDESYAVEKFNNLVVGGAALFKGMPRTYGISFTYRPGMK